MTYKLSNSKFSPEVIPQRIQPDSRTSTELGAHPVSNPALNIRGQSVSTAVGSKELYQRIFDLNRDALVICRVRLFDRDVIVVLIVLIAIDALFSFGLSA